MTYLFAISMGIIYLISMTGYGVRECSRSGSRDLVMLFAASPGGPAHSPSCRPCGGCMQARLLIDAGKSCSYHGYVTSTGIYTQLYSQCGCCCHTTVFVLTDEQTLQNRPEVPSPLPESCSVLIKPESPLLVLQEFMQRAGNSSADLPPLLKTGREALAGLSCWRL